jgi:hypothetical protein
MRLVAAATTMALSLHVWPIVHTISCSQRHNRVVLVVGELCMAIQGGL